MRDMPEVQERVMEKAKKLCSGEIISVEALDMFKSTFRVNKKGGPGASASNAPAYFSFFLLLFTSCQVPRLSCLECNNFVFFI